MKDRLPDKYTYLDDLIADYPESKRFFGSLGICITTTELLTIEQLLTEMGKRNIDEIVGKLVAFIEESRREVNHNSHYHRYR